MAQRDLIDSLQAAISRADPGWVNQPSHLRRRLEEELGADAREHRPQIHLLIVAAEERVPMRLKRNGYSPTERVQLTSLMIASRGWTEAASEWAIGTWAAALGLSDERPAMTLGPPPVVASSAPPVSVETPATIVPDETSTDSTGPVIEPTRLPSERFAPPTELPEPGPRTSVHPSATDRSGDSAEPAGDVDEELVEARSATHDDEVDPPAPRRAKSNRGAPRAQIDSTDLPGAGKGGSLKKASKFLDRQLDVAYEVKAGPTPALLIAVALPIGLAAPFAAALSGVLLMLFMLVIVIGQTVWPKRIVAVAGDQVWLLMARGRSAKPTSLVVETTRDEIEFIGGRPFPAVRIAGQRLWFQYPITKAARQLPTTPLSELPT